MLISTNYQSHGGAGEPQVFGEDFQEISEALVVVVEAISEDDGADDVGDGVHYGVHGVNSFP